MTAVRAPLPWTRPMPTCRPLTPASASSLKEQLDGLDKQRVACAEQQSLQQESLNLITGIFDSVRTNARDLYAEVDSVAVQQAVQGQLFIEQALAAAQRTGYLPEQEQLSEAISAARAGITGGVYATQFSATETPWCWRGS